MTDAPLTVIDDPVITRDATLDEILEEKNEDNQTGIPNTLPEKINDQNILPEIEDNFESRSEKVSTPPEITEPEPNQNQVVESEPDRLVIEPEVPADPGKYDFVLTDKISLNLKLELFLFSRRIHSPRGK